MNFFKQTTYHPSPPKVQVVAK